MSITRLHWAEIDSEHKTLDVDGPCIALWPSPIDADDCFEKAGFNDFEDSNDKWDVDFIKLMETLFVGLKKNGSPRLLSGELPFKKIHFFKSKEGTVFEALEAAAQDDQFPPCLVGFGDKQDSFLLTSDGHPIFWIYPGPKVTPEGWLQSLGFGLELTKTELNWMFLIPNRQRIIL